MVSLAWQCLSSPQTIGVRRDGSGVGNLVLVQFFERRQTEPISTSPYATSTASHICRTMVADPLIAEVSNCPFLILAANSIPLSVTFAFLNLLNPSIG